jgi:hypothetical protein
MYIKDWLRKKSHTALPTSTVSLIGVACVLVKGLCSWDTASSSNSLSTATGVVGVLLLSPCSAAAFGTEPLALLEEAREFGALPPHPTGGSVAEESFAGALGSVKTFMPFMAAISRRSCAPKRFAFCIKRTCLRFSSHIPQTLQCPRHIRKEVPGSASRTLQYSICSRQCNLKACRPSSRQLASLEGLSALPGAACAEPQQSRHGGKPSWNDVELSVASLRKVKASTHRKACAAV